MTKAEDTAESRAAMVRKIHQYQEKLGHLLTSKPPKVSVKTDVDRLREVLYNVETDIAMRGAIENAGAMYMNAMVLLEQSTQVFNPLGLQLAGPAAGLANTVAANKARWDDIVTEVAIKYGEWLAVGPEKRLLFFTVQMVLGVHQANVVGGSLAEQRRASPDLAAAAEDLP